MPQEESDELSGSFGYAGPLDMRAAIFRYTEPATEMFPSTKHPSLEPYDTLFKEKAHADPKDDQYFQYRLKGLPDCHNEFPRLFTYSITFVR